MEQLVVVRPSKKKLVGAESFFRKFYGREGGFYLFFFDSEVLMLKYDKAYPYLLSLLHSSVQAYHIKHKHHIGTQKTYVFGQLIET